MLWLYTHVYLLYNRSYINFKNNKHVAEKGGFEPPEPPLDPALLTHQFSLPLHIAELIALHSDGVWNKHCKTAFKKQVLPRFLKPAAQYKKSNKKAEYIKRLGAARALQRSRCPYAHIWGERGVKGRGIIPVPSRFQLGEPPAKCGRQPQDTESDAEAMGDSSATLDSASLSSSSNAPTRSCFDPGRLSLSSGSRISPSRLESYSKPYDIGTIAEFARYLNGQDMFNVYKPPANYAFPQRTEGQGSHNRSFQPKWLNEHTWLAYSRKKDGGYCVPCLFFCKDL